MIEALRFGTYAVALVVGLAPAVVAAQQPAQQQVEQEAATTTAPQQTEGPSPDLLPEASKRLETYNPVTDERLLNPEPHNWLMVRGNYSGWGYSPLKQINTDNVQNLEPVWAFSTGVNEGHESPPVVNDGLMFISTPQAQVIALDGELGQQLWRYERELPEDLFQLHPTNRGVALYGDKAYVTTTDCFLVALDAKTGQVVWEKAVDDYTKGYYMTLAPLVVEGKVMVGVSGGEFGIRGYVAAFDAETGEEAWRTHTIPGPGEPGHDTWPDDDSWQHGGGSVWMTGHYDPEIDLTFWGTGNAAPWPGDSRPGDNLYTTSVIALDPDTGELKGHHQYHWNDSWDWDEVSPPVLVDVERDGRNIKGLVHPARNGYLWLLERTDGKINFVEAKPYVRQNVFKSIDPKTGRPEYNEDRKPRMGANVDFCPSLWGGKDWPYAAYSPDTKLLYIPANENLCGSLEAVPKEQLQYQPGQLYIAVDIPKIGMSIYPGADHIGEIQAWDLSKMEKVWTHQFSKSHNWGPPLVTAGGVIFAGGTNDRYFRAFDAKTGEVLWEQQTNSGITAPPSTYEIDGKQYIAVQAGWGVDAQRKQEKLDGLLGTALNVPQGGVLWVFALEEEGGQQ
jgi:alcohol dehydrogenase (cytochrome c)